MADSEKQQQDQPQQHQQQQSQQKSTPTIPIQNTTAEKSSSSSVSEGGATQDGKGAKETVVNGDHESPKKSPSKVAVPKKLATSQSPMKSPSKASSPKTPDTPGTAEKKKLPMNKIQVGAAPSPNLKTVKSKIGSLENAKYKPGGGHVKIESRKLNFNVQPKIEAKNETYAPKGGDKKIQSVKLQWNAKPKVGSLENAAHKPGGGDKKIESVKLDFKDKAKPKVGSKDNIKHVAGGGSVKIEDQKLEIKAQSKVGSLDNVKYKPGGGEKKIFDDKNYLKQMAGSASDISATPNQGKKDSRRNSSSRSKSTEPKLSTRDISIDGFSTPEPTKPTDQNFNQLSEKNTQGKNKKDLNVTKSSEQLLQSDVNAETSVKENNSIENVTTEKNEEIKDDSKKDANGNGKLEIKHINNSLTNNSNSAEITENDIKLSEENVKTIKENNTDIIKVENEISSKNDKEIKESEISNSINNQKDLTTKSDELPLSSSENSISKEFVMVEKDIEDETPKPSLSNI